jgi:hypothetical protein
MMRPMITINPGHVPAPCQDARAADSGHAHLSIAAQGAKLDLEAKPSGQGEDLRLDVAPHFQFPIGGIAREGGKSSGQC